MGGCCFVFVGLFGVLGVGFCVLCVVVVFSFFVCVLFGGRRGHCSHAH